MFEFFKGDEKETAMFNCANKVITELELARDQFYDEAFSCFVLGDIIWDSGRSPLANAIAKNIFRESFSEIFEVFLEAGSFEGYLSVFRRVFGQDVAVEFEVPQPGCLNINIASSNLEVSDLVARYIENNNYLYDEIITRDGDNIAVRAVKGIESQYELEQMLFELVPNGIFTTITLVVGD